MAYYVHLFETNNDFQSDYHGSVYTEPWTSYNLERHSLEYNKTEYERLHEIPLTFEIITDGNIVWKTTETSAGTMPLTIEYSKNGGAWTNITSTTAGTSFNVATGDEIQFRGNNVRYAQSTTVYNTFSGSTCDFNIKGNIASLIDKDNFTTLTASTQNYCFSNLFSYSYVVSAKDLVLPLLTMPYRCYVYLFLGCSKLVYPPLLPSTTLGTYCYNAMFYNCAGLTEAPELPATTLVEGCYDNMFRGCTSLVTAPLLPALTLPYRAYRNMFYNCSNLNEIKCFATDISADSATTMWVRNVAANGTFSKNKNMDEWTTGTSGIPENWNIRDVNVN